MSNRNLAFASLAAIAAAATAQAGAPPQNTVASATLSQFALAGIGTNIQDFDINGDSFNDFQITWNSSSRDVVIANIAPNSAYTTPGTVSLETVIDGAQAFQGIQSFTAPTSGTAYYGMTFADSAATSTYYGWFEFDYASDSIGELSAFYGTTPGVGVTVTAVPEPSAGLAAAGLAGAAALGFRQRRKKKA